MNWFYVGTPLQKFLLASKLLAALSSKALYAWPGNHLNCKGLVTDGDRILNVAAHYSIEANIAKIKIAN